MYMWPMRLAYFQYFFKINLFFILMRDFLIIH